MKTLYASSSSVSRFEWYTGWLTATGIDTVRAVLKIQNADASFFKARLAYQTANVRTNKPNAPTGTGTWYTDDGENCPNDYDVSTPTSSAFFVRFGVEYQLSEGSTPEGADVSLQVSYGAKGQVVGSASQEVLAPDTVYKYLPLCDWVPALSAAKYKVAYVVSDAHANFTTRIAYQTAATSVEAPDGWTTGGVEGADDREVCNEVTISTSNKMWVRFAVAYKCSTGTNLAANISGAAATKG